MHNSEDINPTKYCVMLLKSLTIQKYIKQIILTGVLSWILFSSRIKVELYFVCKLLQFLHHTRGTLRARTIGCDLQKSPNDNTICNSKLLNAFYLFYRNITKLSTSKITGI